MLRTAMRSSPGHRPGTSGTRQAVSAHWDIDSIDPAFVYVRLPDVPNLPAHGFEVDQRGRVKLPAFLLSAHKGS